MANSLKDQTRASLLWVLCLNSAFLIALLTSQVMSFSALAVDIKTLQQFVPAGIAIVLCGILSDQISPAGKARLVFLRWTNPLPGSRAFTEIGPKDARVNMKALGKVPTAPDAQNAAWYSLYKAHENDLAVYDAHRAFLSARDYTALAALMLVAFGGISAIFVRPSSTAAIYVAFLLVQVSVVRQAASTAGNRFVANVLASAATPRPKLARPKKAS